jgi:hypothetical protein
MDQGFRLEITILLCVISEYVLEIFYRIGLVWSLIKFHEVEKFYYSCLVCNIMIIKWL